MVSLTPWPPYPRKEAWVPNKQEIWVGATADPDVLEMNTKM